MSLTVRQMIQEAFEQSTILLGGSTPESDEQTTALQSYNLLIRSKIMGAWAQVGSAVIGDTFPLPEELEDYFAAMLAVRLCTKFGKAIPSAVAALATQGENEIKGSQARGITLDMDDGLKNMPSQRSARLI